MHNGICMFIQVQVRSTGRNEPDSLGGCAVERHEVPNKAQDRRWAWAGVKHGAPKGPTGFMALGSTGQPVDQQPTERRQMAPAHGGVHRPAIRGLEGQTVIARPGE